MMISMEQPLSVRAGIINALELAGKKINEAKIVINGAGAAAIACTNLIISLGAKKENIVMLDSKGALRKDRKDLNKYKMEFVTSRDVNTLEEAMKGADIFLGLSKANIVTKEMVSAMAKNPNCFCYGQS